MSRRRFGTRLFLIACAVAAAGGLGLLLGSSLSPSRGEPREEARPSSAILTRVPISAKVVALTFDFDMTPGMLFRMQSGEVEAWYDPTVLHVLRQERIPYTIFITGLATLTYPDLARSFAHDRLVELGNHSHRHFAFTPDCFGLPFIGEGRAQEDIETAQQTIQRITGVTPRYFRFPGGCLEAGDVAIVNNLGLRIVHWDVAAGDAFNPDADSIIHYVGDRARPGSIIAFHLGGPNAPATADALRAIIPSLRAHGYKFTTVTGLLSLLECGAKGPVGRRSLPFSLTPAAWKAPCRDKPPVL